MLAPWSALLVIFEYLKSWFVLPLWSVPLVGLEYLTSWFVLPPGWDERLTLYPEIRRLLAEIRRLTGDGPLATADGLRPLPSVGRRPSTVGRQQSPDDFFGSNNTDRLVVRTTESSLFSNDRFFLVVRMIKSSPVVRTAEIYGSRTAHSFSLFERKRGFRLFEQKRSLSFEQRKDFRCSHSREPACFSSHRDPGCLAQRVFC